MRISPLRLFLALSLIVGLASCEQTSPPLKESPTLERRTLSDLSAVPREFGDLIAVTPTHGGSWARLWFQDSDGIIRTVGHNLDEDRLGKSIRFIPRN